MKAWPFILRLIKDRVDMERVLLVMLLAELLVALLMELLAVLPTVVLVLEAAFHTRVAMVTSTTETRATVSRVTEDS